MRKSMNRITWPSLRRPSCKVALPWSLFALSLAFNGVYFLDRVVARHHDMVKFTHAFEPLAVVDGTFREVQGSLGAAEKGYADHLPPDWGSLSGDGNGMSPVSSESWPRFPSTLPEVRADDQ